MKKVIFVHAIDTEGPLYESVDAKFERIKNLYDVTFEKKDLETIEKLKKEQISVNGKEKEIALMLSSHLTNYNDDWSKIYQMHDRIFNEDFRMKDSDSFDKPWVFSWHCLDHVGYMVNPRRRDLGHHKIFDRYTEILSNNFDYGDKIYWHFHPMSMYKEAHKCATSYINSPELYEILCRKVIDRNFFPSCFRAGFQAERPDSNWFLEQWIPFDITNMSYEELSHLENNLDFKNGRSGDWRRATKEWEVYNPSHDDYQKKGNCRRYIGRALNVLNRIASINEYEMEKAFSRAQNDKPTLVGFASHDFRDLEHEVNYLRELIKKTAKKFPDVKFQYMNTKDAFNEYLFKSEKNFIDNIKLDLSYHEDENDYPRIVVRSVKGEVFGPQPFLCFKRKDGKYMHDNLDFGLKKGIWHYAFHDDTLKIQDIEKLSVAANDKYGNTDIVSLNL